MLGLLRLLILAISLVSFTGFAKAVPGAQTGEGNVHVSGTVSTRAKAIVLADAPPILDDGWSVSDGPNDLVVPVGDDGAFAGSIFVKEAAFYRIKAGRQTADLYLRPGSKIEVHFSQDQIAFSGDGAAGHRLLASLDSRIDKLGSELSQNQPGLFTSDLANYRSGIAIIRRQLMAEFENLALEDASVDPAVRERLKADIGYWFADVDLNYPRIHYNETGKLAQVPQDYHQQVAQPFLGQSNHLMSRRYVNFLDSYIRLASAGEYRFSIPDLPKEKLLARYEAIATAKLDKGATNYLIDEMFRGFTISYGPRDWGRVLARFEADNPGSEIGQRYRKRLTQDMKKREAPDEIRVYKTAGGAELEAHVFYPDVRAQSHSSAEPPAAFLFFHGGGWAIGTPEWGYSDCRRLAQKGMVAVSFEYRLADVHGTGIFEAISDVRSAIKWARSTLPIDPDRVVSAGFSAGGHLATASVMVEDPNQDAAAQPNALVIQSSSYDLTKSRFFSAMTGDRAKEVSLTHQAAPNLVPAIFLHGRYDHLAPLEEFQGFLARMDEVGNDYEHHIFEAGHFFRDPEARRQAKEAADAFLARLGFIDAS